MGIIENNKRIKRNRRRGKKRERKCMTMTRIRGMSVFVFRSDRLPGELLFTISPSCV